MNTNIILHEEFLQHQIFVNITESDEPDLEFIPDSVREWILYRLSDDVEGDFTYEQTCGYSGTWHIVPFSHYTLMQVGFWKHNHYSEEALTKEDFIQTYGNIEGQHFYEKWIHTYNCDIIGMAQYFRNEYIKGQAFLNLFFTKFDKYVKRINSQ